jgi:hypothetical protein
LKNLIGLLILASTVSCFARTGTISDIQLFSATLASNGTTVTFAQVGVLDGTNAFPYALPLVDGNGADIPGAKIFLSVCQQALATGKTVTILGLNEGFDAQHNYNPGAPWTPGVSDLFPNGYSKPMIKRVAISP